MPEFPKPNFPFTYTISQEIQALENWRNTKPGRAIPAKANGRLLLATWNIANLGAQDRNPEDYQLLAEMISWFDLIAIQEVNDDLRGIRAVAANLPGYQMLFSDTAGNRERLAYLYDASKITVREKVGEIAIEPSSKRYIKFKGVQQTFDGFDRNPYVASFRVESLEVVLVNVHLYFGSDSTRDKNRRSLEAYAVGRWADLRTRSDYAYSKNIIALGDFNLPKPVPGDPIYDALTSRGLTIPEHSSGLGGNFTNDKFYDQIAFLPGSIANRFLEKGIFDFDGAIFADLWNSRSEQDFRSFLRYYISDHRILWAAFDLT
jgi:endonuclease/exonuclease/phosphatase family metal-dependent hydrolase